MNILPDTIFIKILSNLPVRYRFRCQAVNRKWSQLCLEALKHPSKVHISDNIRSSNGCYCSYCTNSTCCHCHDHMDLKSVIPASVVQDGESCARFFSVVTNVKLLHLHQNKLSSRDVIPEETLKSLLQTNTGINENIESLSVIRMSFSVCLPKLKKLAVKLINNECLESVLKNCPNLTHLSLNERHESDIIDLNETAKLFSKLPSGLKSLDVKGNELDLLSIFASPAIQTLESLTFNSSMIYIAYADPNYHLIPICNDQPKHLKELILRTCSWDKKMEGKVVEFLSSCDNLTHINIMAFEIKVADYLILFSSWKNMVSIKLDSGISTRSSKRPRWPPPEDGSQLLRVICGNQQTSLESLCFTDFQFNSESKMMTAMLSSLKELKLEMNEEELIEFSLRKTPGQVIEITSRQYFSMEAKTLVQKKNIVLIF